MNNRLLAMMVAALVASGCSGEKGGDAAPTLTKARAGAGNEPVAAVLQTTDTPIAKLGYVAVTAPVVGAQSDLRLEFSATAAVPALQIHVEAESITIDPATAQAGISLESGKPASHVVKLTPQREGLTQITVRLRAGAEGGETVYAIPVLVGATASGG